MLIAIIRETSRAAIWARLGIFPYQRGRCALPYCSQPGFCAIGEVQCMKTRTYLQHYLY